MFKKNKITDAQIKEAAEKLEKATSLEEKKSIVRQLTNTTSVWLLNEAKMMNENFIKDLPMGSKYSVTKNVKAQELSFRTIFEKMYKDNFIDMHETVMGVEEYDNLLKKLYNDEAKISVAMQEGPTFTTDAEYQSITLGRGKATQYSKQLKVVEDAEKKRGEEK